MPTITLQAVEEYLRTLYAKPVRVLSMSSRGKQEEGDTLKGFGYGTPLFLEYDVAGERKKPCSKPCPPLPTATTTSPTGPRPSSGNTPRSTISRATCAPSTAGPSSIRATSSPPAGPRSSFSSRNSLSERVISKTLSGSGTGGNDGAGLSARSQPVRLPCGDPCGETRCSAPLRAAHPGPPGPRGMHHGPHRQLPPSFDFIDQALLKRIELLCAEWRWRVKDRSHRLCRVHGDFHPWNILFREGADFTVLDRSRGEWGDPADDVSTMTINYLFFSLQRTGRLEGDMEKMFALFWENYLAGTGDREMLDVIAPFYAWRGLVIASPVWYPEPRQAYAGPCSILFRMSSRPTGSTPRQSTGTFNEHSPGLRHMDNGPPGLG